MVNRMEDKVVSARRTLTDIESYDVASFLFLNILCRLQVVLYA